MSEETKQEVFDQNIGENENEEISQEQDPQLQQAQSDKDKDLSQKGQGYRYWVDPKKQDQNYKPKQPKKIDPVSIQQKQSSVEHKGSAWNTSGTWEEKSVSTDIALPFVKKALGFSGEGDANGITTKDKKIKFTDIEKMSGSISMVYKRNKWFPGFDLKIDLTYEGVEEYKGASGTLKFTDFHDDGDFEFDVVSENEEFKKEALQSINSSLEYISETIRQGLSDLAAH